MESPLLKFLEWFQDLPVLHQRKLALFSIMPNDISSDNDSYDMQSIDKWTTGTINRFKDEILEIDKRLSNTHIPPILKWEGMRLMLSIRSQIDYLLSHDGFYYSTEDITSEYSVLSHSFTSPKIKGFQKSQRDAAIDKKYEMVAQLIDIRSRWEIFRNQYFEDHHIDEWCKS